MGQKVNECAVVGGCPKFYGLHSMRSKDFLFAGAKSIDGKGYSLRTVVVLTRRNLIQTAGASIGFLAMAQQ